MAFFRPKTIFVKPASRHSRKAKEILARARKHDPGVAVEYLTEGKFTYPTGLTPQGMFEFMKQSVIVCERTTSFVKTFPSPGDIVENFETVLNPAWMCCSNCEFCYLQTNQTPEHMLYTNLADMERELRTAPFAHTAGLTLWSMLSMAGKKPFLKIPENLLVVTDDLREHFAKVGIDSDREAIDYLYGKQGQIFSALKGQDLSTFRQQRQTIAEFYTRNLTFPLTLNISEFTDIIAIDHLSGYMNDLMGMLQKYPTLRLKARTKSAYVDELLGHDGQGRFEVIMGLNTEHVIDKFEHGTATLDERIHAAKRVQDAKGFTLRLAIEPIMFYQNWVEEYTQLIDLIFSRLDPKKVSDISIGGVRYRKQLKAMIEKHFPSTELFEDGQELQEPEKIDQRMRYTVERRVEVYSQIITAIRKHSGMPIGLGAEKDVIWDRLQFDKVKALSSSVYQYDGVVDLPDPDEQAEDMTDMADREESGLNEMSNAALIAFQAIQQNQEDIDVEKFGETVKALEGMTAIVKDSQGHVEYEDDEVLWRDLDALDIAQATDGGHTWKPVRIVGKLKTVGSSEPIDLDDSGGHAGGMELQISDLRDQTLTCLYVPNEMVTDLRGYGSSYRMLSFCGAVVVVTQPKKKNARDWRFYLHRISDRVSAGDILGMKPKGQAPQGTLSVMGLGGLPADHPYWIVSKRKGLNGLLAYIKDQLTTNLSIKGLGGTADDLELAIEFAILQAFSQGRGQFSHKLHSLLIGPPNAGKGLVTRIALILNPVGQELSGTAPKLTAAGLVGSVKAGKQRNVSVPGYFPTNSFGVVCMQDFHGVLGNKRDEMFTIFSKLMQDGEVIDSTSTKATHPAETSLHLDMNRYSDIYPDRPFNSYNDIDIPIHILSRFDTIIEIPKDAVRQEDVALLMSKSVTTMGGVQSMPGLPDWVRKLKMLVAFLRTQYDRVDFSNEVNEYMQTELQKLWTQYSSLHVPDMQVRMTQSLQKIVKAIACGNATEAATREFVDYAMPFLRHKMDFIVRIDEKDIRQVIVDINKKETRQQVIRDEYSGKEFSAKEVQEYLLANHKQAPDEKTIKRDLKDLGGETVAGKRGMWRL